MFLKFILLIYFAPKSLVFGVNVIEKWSVVWTFVQKFYKKIYL